jgi:hypothetical protein
MEVGAWLRYLGLERYEPAFRNSEITAEVLPELTDAGLQELGPARCCSRQLGPCARPQARSARCVMTLHRCRSLKGNLLDARDRLGQTVPKIVARGVVAYGEEVIVALRQQNPGTGIRRWSQCSEPRLKTLSQHAEQA